MAYIEVKQDEPSVQSGQTGGFTKIMTGSPSTINGILRFVTLYCQAGGTLKIKVFTDDGTNYVFWNEVSITVSSGANIDIPIGLFMPHGGMIGFFSAAGLVFPDFHNGGSRVFQAGDITTTTAKALWTTQAIHNEIKGKVFHKIAPF